MAIVLTGVVAAGLLAAGAATAAPVDDPHHVTVTTHKVTTHKVTVRKHRLTAKEKAGLRIAHDVLGSLFGAVELTLGGGR
ncbi:hypothetical protein [Streptomyces sp. NPDC093589]|uniref:hypothetical protein n=1 Tax=Streptomyces sp. NPDC093589 TaxID=3366043 RepID=UPI003806944C